MPVNGCDCSIVIKTAYKEMDIPYSSETIREAISIMKEEPSIEGDYVHRGLPHNNGMTGCIVTPLNIETVPFLLYLAMGGTGNPVFITETRNLYRNSLNLLPYEDGPQFDLVQKRGNGKWFYEGCGVTGFELRIMREETIKLKIDICGEKPPVNYSYNETIETESRERFSGNSVVYKINGKEYKNIYGITIAAEKEEGTKTELWIKRCLEDNCDLPHLINDMTITAHLYRDSYEYRSFGMFRLSFTNVVLNTDETVIDAANAVIGPIRYYVAGITQAEVFSVGDGRLE